MLVGLVSDTHGVFDPALRSAFAGVDHILHAGDVGSHGGAAEVLQPLREVAPVTAVRGNVDDDAAALQLLPALQLLHLAGWCVLVAHVLDSRETVADIQRHQPDIVVTGHSHKYSVVERGEQQARRLLVNPGSAGPARFKLGRTAALLTLPDKGSGGWPTVQRVELAAKAPPRRAAASGRANAAALGMRQRSGSQRCSRRQNSKRAKA